MAQPSLTPYATGYPCKTGASVNIGGYAKITLYANHQCGTRRVIGQSAGTADGLVWAIEPVITWADAETGWYWHDEDVDGTNIPDDVDWRSWNAAGKTRKNIKLAWKLIVREPAVGAVSAKNTIILVDALMGVLNEGTGYYELPASFAQVSGQFEFTSRFAMEQRVEITETDNTAGEWINLPEEFRKEGMGKLHAEFTRVWDDEMAGAVTINGVAYNILPWTASAGVASVDLQDVNPTVWYPAQEVWWLSSGGIIGSSWPGSGADSYPKAKVGEAIIGTSAADYYLPDNGDHETDKTFRLWDKWDASFAEADGGAYSCELIGAGNTFSAWACGNGGSYLYGVIEWTQPPYTYQFVGEMKYLDNGATPDGTPEFENISSPYVGETLTWNGLTSPVYRGGGLWKISGTSERTGGRFLPDPDWATYAAEAADGDGVPDDEHAYISGPGGTCWFEQDTVPQAWDPPWFCLKWLNPDDFGGYADGGRVLLRYPRAKDVLRVGISDNLTVDSFSDDDWQGYGCTVEAEGGGGIRVTDVETGAYIWRTYPNKAEGPPAVPGTYWPGHRYARLDCTCYEEGTETQTPFIGKLRFGGRNVTDAGVSTTWTRTHSHRLRDEYFDVCRIDEESLPNADLEQSWITQALPEQSWDRNGEKTLMSWSWGPGAINRIEVLELSPGIDYVFRELEACQLTLKLDTTTLPARSRAMCQTAHEYAAKRLLGWTGLVGVDDEESLERILAYIVNGRTAFESGACHEAITYSGETPTFERANYSIQSIDDGTNRWPADTFGGLAITDLIAWGNAWWDAVNSIYLDERVLFCPEVTPAWFLEDGVQAEATSAPNTGLCTLSARPIYDWITPDIYYGDGGDEETRPGKHIFRFKILVGNRLHGMMWKDAETAEETEGDGTFDYSVSNPSASDSSSEIGNYHSPVQLNPTDLVFETKTESGIAVHRPNSWVRCCLYISVAPGGIGIDAAIHPLTGIGFVAWSEAGAVYVARTTNYGKTFEAPIEVTTGVLPCLATANDAEKHWALAWETGGDVKMAWTPDGFASLGEVTDIMAASHYTRICGNPLTGALMLVAWKDTGDLVSKMSRDFGKTFGAEVTIASSVPEQAFGLTHAVDPRDIWTVVWKNAAGDIQTYWSANDGGSWSLASTV